MANKTPLANYGGLKKEITAGDTIPIANLATGTPDGTKFIRDDGTLATPAGGGGGSTLNETINTDGFTIDEGSITNSSLKVSGGGSAEIVIGNNEIDFPFMGTAIFGKTTEVEIDFGSYPVTEKEFTITNVLAATTSFILIHPSGNIPSSGSLDEWLWDSINFAAKGNTGNFTLYAKASGLISGKRKILYIIN